MNNDSILNVERETDEVTEENKAQEDLISEVIDEIEETKRD